MKRTGQIILGVGLVICILAGQAQGIPAKRLTWNSGNSESPDLAIDSWGNPHVVWADSTPGNTVIYYKRSTDGGATWLASQRLTWTPGYSFDPAISVDSYGNVHVIWSDTPSLGLCDIYYRRSTDGGATWLASQRLTWNSGWSLKPAIAADYSGNLYMVWYDDTPAAGYYQIYCRRSKDGGSTWLASQRLTWSSAWSMYPALALDKSGNVHVVWEDHAPGNYEIYSKKSTDGGASWLAGKRLTSNSGGSENPDIAVDSLGNLWVVWDDETPSGYEEIYYKASTNEGSTWIPSQRLTWTAGSSEFPSIAADSDGHIHVVFEDNTPGNYEIYYF
jgi:hypothetical protein